MSELTEPTGRRLGGARRPLGMSDEEMDSFLRMAPGNTSLRAGLVCPSPRRAGTVLWMDLRGRELSRTGFGHGDIRGFQL